MAVGVFTIGRGIHVNRVVEVVYVNTKRGDLIVPIATVININAGGAISNFVMPVH